MPLPLLSNSYALLIAGLLAISSSVGQPANRDPYFTPTAAKSTSTMPRVIIRNMREDRAGNIWFATFGGPIRYDGKDFTNFSEEVGLAKTRIFSLLEARSGALWFGSITGGASRYDGKSFTKFTDKEGLGNNDVDWIFEDRDANIWFGTGNGVSRYDGKVDDQLHHEGRARPQLGLYDRPRCFGANLVWNAGRHLLLRRQIVFQSRRPGRKIVREYSLDGCGPIREPLVRRPGGGLPLRRQDGDDIHFQGRAAG